MSDREEKVVNQNIIQWYPGHMAKAKREIKEKMKMIDLVIELKDARIPNASTNPIIDEIVGNKPRLILLCKSQMADLEVTREWMNWYAQKNLIALDIDSLSGYHIKEVYNYARLALKDTFALRKSKGISSQTIKAIILGIPNVGKSTLINTLAKRKATTVGDKPGVTKNQTWIKINSEFFIMDTPGILWPKFEDPEVGVKLAMCGSIKDELLDMEYLAVKSIEYMKRYYPHFLEQRYQVGIMDTDLMIMEIGKKRGFLLKGGIVDYERVYKMLLLELRSLKIGRMSYERPEEFI